MDSFDGAAQQTFKSNLASQLDGVSASDIQLTVEAGSLVVVARIFPAADDPAADDIGMLVTALSSDQFINTLATSLGYPIEAMSVPLVESVAFAAQSPSSSLEPPILVAIAVGVAVAILSCVAGVYLALRHKHRRAKRAESELASIPSVIVQLAPSQTSSTMLPASLDRVLLTSRVRRLHPMLRPAQQWILHSPGVHRAVATDSEMRITKGRLYIEQAAAAGATDSNGLLEQWPLATLVSVKRRRHEMRHVALELILATQQDGRPGAQASVLLGFNSHDDRERVVQTLLSERPQLVPPDECLQEMTEKWHEGDIDNFTYLLHLNECASRSFCDLSQYPIMCAFARSPLSPQTPLLC